ncbi:MAG: multidrug effflux MFS transporter [Litoreibacter sp.]
MNTPDKLSLPEFIGLIAMTFAMVAFSIDAMLPALPTIGAEISPDDINRAQLVLTSFVFGMGIGTFFTGPLSDSFGRKPVIFGGTIIFVIGAALASQATSIESMFAARCIQGFGVAGPRIVAVAIVRDQYQGRQMASILSYVMLVFSIVPAVAPAFGALIIDAYGWRAVFLSFIIFAVIVIGWMMIRQRETLPVAKRVPFKFNRQIRAVKECFGIRIFALSTLAQVVAYAVLFGTLSSVQQIFDQTYGRAESFPLWFALIALISSMASIINARFVITLGMRKMAGVGYGIVAVLSFCVLISGFSGVPFWLYLCLTTGTFFMAGLVIGNLNALAMEPVGHIAGLASSIIGATATISGVLIAIPIGLLFNGTPVPLAAATFILSSAGVILIATYMKSSDI